MKKVGGTNASQACLTYELHRSVQPGQDLFTEAVVDRHPQEVRLWDEVRFGAGVAGVEHVSNVVLLHELLREHVTCISTRSDPRQTPSCCSEPHLVKHVSLAAQVQVRQDPRRPAAAHGKAGLRDAGRHQRGLPFTQTREQMRELCETTCGQ